MPTTVIGGEETPQPQPEGQAPPPAPADPPENGGSPAPRTVEEVEEAWRYRVSQKDKAHAAAEAALREERDALQRRLDAASRAPANGQQDGGGNDALLRDQLAEARREAETERQLRAIEAKRAKYPALAKTAPADDGIWTSSEATLARLNVLADDDSNPGFAPTTPRKAAPVPAKQLGDMSKEELEAELKRAVTRGDHTPKR